MKIFAGAVVGSFCAVVCFLIVATFFVGDPFGDWFLSAHAIFSAEKQAELTEADNLNIYKLLSRGLVISSDGIIESITSLYGNMIQTLIGMLAMVTLLAFFAVRWTSVQATHDFVEQKANSYFASGDFETLVRNKTADAVDLVGVDWNGPESVRSEIDAMASTIAELNEKVQKMEEFISANASAEEPEDTPPPPIKRRPARRK